MSYQTSRTLKFTYLEGEHEYDVTFKNKLMGVIFMSNGKWKFSSQERSLTLTTQEMFDIARFMKILDEKPKFK